jgi:cytochrome P450
MPTLPVFDPADVTLHTDPYGRLKLLREENPVHFVPALKGWAVFRYGDVQSVLLAPAMSADKITPFYRSLGPEQRSQVQVLVDYLGRWLVFRDPPDHMRLRALVARAFTPRALAELRPEVERLVEMLIDRLHAKQDGPVDLVAEFANPLPAYVIMDMLGVPRGMLDDMRAWSEDIKLFIGTARQTPDKYALARRGVEAMADAFRKLIAERRTEPKSDLLSSLIGVHDAQDGRLSEEELIATAILFLFAGHETTASLISMASIELIRHPHARAEFLDHAEFTGTAVEEFLRYDGPTPSMMRIATVDHEIGGHPIRAGERVWAFIGAANRDPAEFSDPDLLDIARAPNRHVTFGFGPHFCLGAPLARMEAQIALPALHRRYPQMSLAEAPGDWNDGLTLRGPRRVMVRLGRAA